MNFGPSRLKNMYSQKRKLVRSECIQSYFKKQRTNLTNSLTVQLLIQKLTKSKYLTHQILNEVLQNINSNNFQQYWDQKINQVFIQKCLNYNSILLNFQKQTQNDSLNSYEKYSTAASNHKKQFQFFDIILILVLNNLLSIQTVKQKLFPNLVKQIKSIKRDQNRLQQSQNLVLKKYCFRVLLLIKKLLISQKIQYQFSQILLKQFQTNLQNSIMVSLHQIIQNQFQNEQLFQENQSIFFKSHTIFLEIIILSSKLKHIFFPIYKCSIFKDIIIQNTIKSILIFNLQDEQQQNNSKNKDEVLELQQLQQFQNQSEIESHHFKFNCIKNCYQFFIFLAVYSVQLKQQGQANSLIQKNLCPQDDFYEKEDDERYSNELWKIDSQLFSKILKVPDLLQKIKIDLINQKLSKKILFLINILIDNQQVLKMLIQYDILTTLTIMLVKCKKRIQKKQLKQKRWQNFYYQIFCLLIKLLRLGNKIEDVFFQRVIRQHYTSKYFLNCIGQIIYGYPVNCPNEWQYCSISRTKFSKSILQSSKIFEIITELLQVMIQKYNLNRLLVFLDQSKNRKRNNIMNLMEID